MIQWFTQVVSRSFEKISIPASTRGKTIWIFCTRTIFLGEISVAHLEGLHYHLNDPE
jgi:hypothetical protein